MYSRDGFFTILPPGEAVSKLGVGKLVQTPGSRDTEVAPHVLIAAEIQLLHRSGARLETLRSDTDTTLHLLHKLNQK